LVLGIANPVKQLSVFGQISSLDWSGINFEKCYFKDVEFYNCTFSELTRFSDCRFEGNLAFVNCRLAGSAILSGCELSEDAEREWDRQAGRASRSVITEKSAKEALREILRRFVGPFGFSTIKDADKNSGVIKRNPCGEAAWDELIKAKIVERHPITGVPAGGLHISEDSEVRHEVRNFLDNAALGPRLQRVIEAILKRS
jgi:hypothetical protein